MGLSLSDASSAMGHEGWGRWYCYGWCVYAQSETGQGTQCSLSVMCHVSWGGRTQGHEGLGVDRLRDMESNGQESA